MKRKVLLLLMVVVLLLGMVTPAYGYWWGSWGGSSPSSEEYDLVSLGDSTAVGTRPTSLPVIPADYPKEIYFSGGYFELLADNHFEDSAVTHAVDGKDSRDILRDLWRNRAIRNDVRNAEEAIILCVGGNDLLGRVIDSAFEYGSQLYNNYPGVPNIYPKPPIDPNYTEKLLYFESLALAIVSDGGPNLLNSALYSIIDDANLMEGVVGFSLRYPSIIRTITRLNDDAEIYVMNIFNPIPKTNDKNLEEIRLQLEVLLGLMNGVIERNANRYENVHLIDVHHEFIDNPAPPPVFFVPPSNLDPHPTDEGQELIYDLIVEKMEEVDD